MVFSLDNVIRSPCRVVAALFGLSFRELSVLVAEVGGRRITLGLTERGLVSKSAGSTLNRTGVKVVFRLIDGLGEEEVKEEVEEEEEAKEEEEKEVFNLGLSELMSCSSNERVDTVDDEEEEDEDEEEEEVVLGAITDKKSFFSLTVDEPDSFRSLSSITEGKLCFVSIMGVEDDDDEEALVV